jgi:hypothetical protein
MSFSLVRVLSKSRALVPAMETRSTEGLSCKSHWWERCILLRHLSSVTRVSATVTTVPEDRVRVTGSVGLGGDATGLPFTSSGGREIAENWDAERRAISTEGFFL